MCDCIKKVSAKLEERMKDEIGIENVYSYDHIGFDNAAIMFSMKGGLSGTDVGIPFSIKYFRKKKDGSRGANVTTFKQNVFASYCPFCGEKKEAPSKEEEASE